LATAPRAHVPKSKWTAPRVLAVPALSILAASCTASSTPAAAPAPAPTVAPASDADLQAVMAAVDKTASSSARVDLALSATKVFGSAGAPVVGTGTFDFKAAQGTSQIQQPAGPESIVFLPSSVFVRQPTGPNVLPRGKTWISAGLTESALTTNFPQFVIQTEALNPVFLLDQTAWGLIAAAPLGPTSVDGGDAHGYLVTVDLARASSRTSGTAGSAFAKAIGFELNALGGSSPTAVTTVEVRVWVDDLTGNVVRIQSSPPGAGAGVVTVTFHDFGTDVRVAAPRSSKVADIASLSPGGERENNGGGDSDGA
jgi:hypothetical protein